VIAALGWTVQLADTSWEMDEISGPDDPNETG
jgi:hypothetical protein